MCSQQQLLQSQVGRPTCLMHLVGQSPLCLRSMLAAAPCLLVCSACTCAHPLPSFSLSLPTDAATMSLQDFATQLPQDIPRCSSVLAATVRRLLRQQPEAVRLEGQLPDRAFPGLAGEGLSLEEEERSQQQVQQQPQGAAAAAGTGRVLAPGGNARPATQQLSIAERVRQQLAAKAAAKVTGGKAAPAKAGVSGSKRQAAPMDGADQLDLCDAA